MNISKTDFSQSKIAFPSTFKEDLAATTIQKIFRGELARQSFLPRSFYPDYKVLCEKTLITPSVMPRAQDGKIPVYLPIKMPEVVLKHAGRQKAIERFHLTNSMRAIARSLGCSSIVIPEERLYRSFQVVRRLPIPPNVYGSIETYRSKKHLFNDVARDMTRLFSKAYIACLIRGTESNCEIARIRYDNIPLYTVKEKGVEQGRIGFVDPDHFDNNNVLRSDTYKLRVLAHIFPYHYKMILEEADKLGIKTYEDEVIESAILGHQYLIKNINTEIKNLQKKTDEIKNKAPLHIMTPHMNKEILRKQAKKDQRNLRNFEQNLARAKAAKALSDIPIKELF